MTITAAVPMASASGRLRDGLRTSSAIYAAAFQPEYMNITGTSPNSHPEIATGPADPCRFPESPAPNANEKAMNSTNALTFSVVKTLLTIRPGPTPRTCTSANATMTAMATMACRENVIGRYGSGMTKNGA